MSNWVLRVVPSVLLLLASCGGGGGTEVAGTPPPVSPPPSSTDPSVSASAQTVTVTGTTSDSFPELGGFNLTLANPPANGVFIRTSATSNGIVESQISVASATQAGVGLYFRAPTELGVGTYRDTVTVSVCFDIACSQPVPGSPITVAVNYSITAGTPIVPTAAVASPRMSAKVLPIGVNDLAWDRVSQRLFVSIASASPIPGNTITRIDPSTGGIELPGVYAGSEPGSIAISDDGQFVYTSNKQAVTISRIRTSDMTRDLTIPLVRVSSSPLFTGDLAVAPGAPHTVAAVRNDLGSGYSRPGIVIFDDAVPRAGIAGQGNSYSYSSLQWGADANTLYAPSPFSELQTFGIGGSGATTTTTVRAAGLDGKIHFDGGRVFGDSGVAINPASGAVVSQFNVIGPMVPDSANDRAYFVTTGGNGYVVNAYRISTSALVESVPLPTFRGQPSRLIRWGTDGLAFSTSAGDLVLLNGPIVSAATPAPNLTLVTNHLSQSGFQRNADPLTASIGYAVSSPPASLVIQHSETSSGLASVQPQPNGSGSGSLQISFRAPASLAAGTYYDRITVRACLDATCTAQANGSPSVISVALTISPDRSLTIRQFPMGVAGSIWDPTASRFYLSLPNVPGIASGGVASYDPVSGALGPVTAIAGGPTVLARSADSRYLYVGSAGQNIVQRLQLPQLQQDVAIPLTTANNSPLFAYRIAVAPDRPQTVAVLLSDPNILGSTVRSVIYDDAVPRARDAGSASVTSLAWGTDSSLLYGADGDLSSFEFFRFGIDSSGFASSATFQSVYDNFDNEIQYTNGLIYSNLGTVLDPSSVDLQGRFAARGQVAIDVALNKAFFVARTQDFNLGTFVSRLIAFDLRNYRPLGSVLIPNAGSDPARLERWGLDGLAMTTVGGRFVLISGAFVTAPVQ